MLSCLFQCPSFGIEVLHVLQVLQVLLRPQLMLRRRCCKPEHQDLQDLQGLQDLRDMLQNFKPLEKEGQGC